MDLDLRGSRGDRLRLTFIRLLEGPQGDDGSFSCRRLENVVGELECRAVGGLAGESRLEAEAHVRLELLSRRADLDASSDRDGVQGRGVQRMLGHEREDSAVLLEPAFDLGFDGHVAGRIDDPLLVERDLDPGVERDTGFRVSRQGGDDTERLMRLECPANRGSGHRPRRA